MGGSGAVPGFVGPEAYTIFGTLFKKKEYKITNTKLGTSEYLFSIRKEFTTNHKFNKLTNKTNITNSENKVILSLIDCMAHLQYIFLYILWLHTV